MSASQSNARRRSLSVIVSALNEEKNIAGTIRSILEAGDTVPDLQLEILVVDDGSTDRTSEIVSEIASKRAGIRLLKNPQNIGLGASIRRAIGEATMEKCIFVPADNDIPRVTLDVLFANVDTADMVMTYFHNDECRGRSRYLLSSVFLVIYTTFFDLYVLYINGPAVYPTKALKSLDLCSTRFSIVAEINVKLLRQGLSFVEVPSYRQVGMQGSTSLSGGNLLETVRVFLRLLADVHVFERQKYSRRPVRIPYVLTLKLLDEPAVSDRIGPTE